MKRTLIDSVCFNDHQARDVWREADGSTPRCIECGSPTTRLFLPDGTADPHGDECDVWIRHGICHENGDPKHYTSKSEMAKEAKRRGVVPMVRHIGRRGGDRNPHTQRFI